MGATTKSITGLFANVCGRNVCGRTVREQIAAGHGTRSAAAQGYLPLSLRSRHLHGGQFITGFTGRGKRSGAVASETAGRTTYVGAPEYVGNIESGAVSSQFQAASLRRAARERGVRRFHG